MQERIIQIWKVVLNVEEVRPEDNFFDLGGDSISAMLCLSRMRRELGVEIPFEDFFATDTTVEKISRGLDQS